MEYILSPSILSADFKALGEQMKATGRKWSPLSAFRRDGRHVCTQYFFWDASAEVYTQCHRPGNGRSFNGAGANPICGSVPGSGRPHCDSPSGSMPGC